MVGIWFRICAAIAAVVLAAVSLTLDSADVLSRGLTTTGIGVAFLLFAGMAGWQIVEQHQRLTAYEHSVRIAAHGVNDDWRGWDYPVDTRRARDLRGHFFIELENRASEKRLPTAYWVIWYQQRTWRKPWNTTIAVVPLKPGTDGIPADWVLEPFQKPQREAVFFHKLWHSPEDGRAPQVPLAGRLELDLVVDFGSPDRRRRVHIDPPRTEGKEPFNG